jgi:hypothetical protein
MRAITHHSCTNLKDKSPFANNTRMQVCGEQSTLRQRYEGALESKSQTICDLRRELKEARKAAGQVRSDGGVTTMLQRGTCQGCVRSRAVGTRYRKAAGQQGRCQDCGWLEGRHTSRQT